MLLENLYRKEMTDCLRSLLTDHRPGKDKYMKNEGIPIPLAVLETLVGVV